MNTREVFHLLLHAFEVKGEFLQGLARRDALFWLFFLLQSSSTVPRNISCEFQLSTRIFFLMAVLGLIFRVVWHSFIKHLEILDLLMYTGLTL